jgi:adenosine/AMP kinase
MAENENKEPINALNFTEKVENVKQYFAALENVLQLIDLTTNSTKTWTVYSKIVLGHICRVLILQHLKTTCVV